MFKHLLIATDGSDIADKALDAALEIAGAHGSKIIILTSTDPVATGLGGGGFGTIDAGTILVTLEETYEQEARKLLDAAKQRAAAAGIEATSVHTPRQRAADAIIMMAEQAGCDTIIMGSHGRRGLQRVLLGSQASEVLARSKVPVLIVK